MSSSRRRCRSRRWRWIRRRSGSDRDRMLRDHPECAAHRAHGAREDRTEYVVRARPQAPGGQRRNWWGLRLDVAPCWISASRVPGMSAAAFNSDARSLGRGSDAISLQMDRTSQDVSNVPRCPASCPRRTGRESQIVNDGPIGRPGRLRASRTTSCSRGVCLWESGGVSTTGSAVVASSGARSQAGPAKPAVSIARTSAATAGRPSSMSSIEGRLLDDGVLLVALPSQPLDAMSSLQRGGLQRGRRCHGRARAAR